MKRTMLIKCIRPAAFILCCTAILFSCNDDIYDNVKEYANEETVYPAHFDTIYGSIGFERVEIDLCKAGRVPASKMKLGKAKRTIIEFTNNGKDTVVIYDSLCSWVNITGLKQPNLYQFKVYTDNGKDYGDRSVPKLLSKTPYTVEDRDAMSLPEPSVMSSTTSAQVQWKSSLSSDLGDILSWEYSYVNRDGDTITGGDVNDAPAFFIENVPSGSPTTVNIISQIIPKVDGNRILDTIYWTFPVNVDLVGENPIIFLDKPYLDDLLKEDSLPTFSWFKIDEADGYLLKLSSSSNFPDDASMTTVIPVGDVGSYTMTRADFRSIRGLMPYWTIVPTTPNERVITQSRRFVKNISTVAEMRENYVHLNSIKSPGEGQKRLEGLRQLTVEGWLKPTGDLNFISSFFGVENYFLLRFGDSAPREELQFATNSGGFNSRLRLNGSVWHHVAVTFDVNTRTVIFYLNGEEVDRKAGDAPGNYPDGISFTNRDVHIGKSWDDGRHFPGDMSEVRLWDVVRTQAEIYNDMYNVMSPPTPNLIGYWKFDEGEGRTIHDYSGNNFTNDANRDIVWMKP